MPLHLSLNFMYSQWKEPENAAEPKASYIHGSEVSKQWVSFRETIASTGSLATSEINDHNYI